LFKHSELMTPNYFSPPFGAPSLRHGIKGRNKDQRKECRDGESSNHSDSQRGIGLSTSPNPRAIGINPQMVQRDVIKIGLRRILSDRFLCLRQLLCPCPGFELRQLRSYLSNLGFDLPHLM